MFTRTMAAIIETGRKRRTLGRYLLCCCCCCCWTSEGSSLGLTSKAAALPANASAAAPQPSSTLYADRCATPRSIRHRCHRRRARQIGISINRDHPFAPRRRTTRPSIISLTSSGRHRRHCSVYAYNVYVCIVVVSGPTTAIGNGRGQRAPATTNKAES